MGGSNFTAPGQREYRGEPSARNTNYVERVHRSGGPVKQGRPIIALIEDDPLVRTAIARALDDASYNVVSAANGAEGLAVIESHDVDLAVIDIVMPGHMDGVALAREARRQDPDLLVIFTSGHPPPADKDLAFLGAFLPKPSRVATLLAMITRLLRERK
jgi:two-component system, cell cycle sensor histidine kinase and response regulator CckA